MLSTKDDYKWLGLSETLISLEAVSSWVMKPDCGAMVTFTGSTRDRSPGRPGVTVLDYEAYSEHVLPQLDEIYGQIVENWKVGRVALLHRIGLVPVSEVSVVVAVSAPHRDDAFEGARFGIDTLKKKVPIWKKETWAEGSDWVSTC